METWFFARTLLPCCPLMLFPLPCPSPLGPEGQEGLPAPRCHPRPFSLPSPENSSFEVHASDCSPSPACRSHLLPVPSLNFFNIFSFWFTAISSQNSCDNFELFQYPNDPFHTYCSWFLSLPRSRDLVPFLTSVIASRGHTLALPFTKITLTSFQHPLSNHHILSFQLTPSEAHQTFNPEV